MVHVVNLSGTNQDLGNGWLLGPNCFADVPGPVLGVTNGVAIIGTNDVSTLAYHSTGDLWTMGFLPGLAFAVAVAGFLLCKRAFSRGDGWFTE